MNLVTSWRDNAERTCQYLGRIENDFKQICEQNSNEIAIRQEQLERLISKINKVRAFLIKDLSSCTTGTFRKAAEHYDRVLQKIREYYSKIAQKIIFPASLKEELNSYTIDEIKRSSQSQTLNLEEQKLLLCLAADTEKKLAHLFGNKISQGKVDHFGVSLEGMASFSCLNLFITLMEIAAAKHPHIFSDTHAGWKNMKKIFSKSLCYFVLISEALSKSVLERK